MLPTNEIAIRQADLPGMPMETVKQYVDMAGAAIDGMKAQLNAQKALGADRDTIERMQAQINEYAGLKLRAEMELGRRTAEMEKHAGARGDLSHPVGEVLPTKAAQLASIGMSSQQASRYETLVKNEAVVNRYVDEELAAGCQPTRSGALRAITEAKRSQRDEALKEAKAAVKTVEQKKESGDMLTITELRAAQDARKKLEQADGVAIHKELGDVLSGVIRFSATHKPGDLDSLSAAIDKKSYAAFADMALSAARELQKIADMIQERRIVNA